MSKPGGHRASPAAMVVLALLIAAFAAAGCAGPNRHVEPQIMPLEQAVGQLLMVGFEGKTISPELENLLTTVHPGGVILFGRNIEDAGQVNELVQSMQQVAQADTGQPLFVAVDQEGGQVRRLTWLDDATAAADIASSQQAYELGHLRGQALEQLGINLNLAPVLDMAAPEDFLYRYGRVLPGGPDAVGILGLNLIQGQADGGIFSTAKHFPGYGGIAYNPETTAIPVLPTYPEIGQFQLAMAAHPEFVMTANVIYNSLDPSLPFSLSPAGIEFLRRTLNGDYLVITDDLASKVLQEKFTLPETLVLARNAGPDILLVSSNQAAQVIAAYRRLLDSVRSGEVDETAVYEAVAKITSLKERVARP